MFSILGVVSLGVCSVGLVFCWVGACLCGFFEPCVFSTLLMVLAKIPAGFW